MAASVVLVNKPVAVDEVAVAGVVGRINVSALDPPGMRHAKVAQGIKIVALDDLVVLRASATRKRRILVKCHKVIVDRQVVVDFVVFPDQPETGPPVALAQQALRSSREFAIFSRRSRQPLLSKLPQAGRIWPPMPMAPRCTTSPRS